MVYILNIDGQPLMPTKRHGKVRRLLKEGKANVIRRCPFVVQLLYKPQTEIIQNITLGVDAGTKHIGLSATTENKVLFEADVKLRTDIVDNIAVRRELRRSRRNRKTRYRKVRFRNRARVKGWLAPSIRQKIDCHLETINKVYKILPVSKIIIEVASFDQQKINNPDISGKEYQQGEQFGFWNVREAVLYRDEHQCQCCKGKSKDKILNVHHIESRKTGGNAPNNLVTLCETCHKNYHLGKIKLSKDIKERIEKRGNKLNNEAYMNTMRWALYNKSKETYSNVHLTYGYITKNTRIENNLPKEHYIDARCISKNPLAESDGSVFYFRKMRCHNRKIHGCKIYKNGIRKNEQVFGVGKFLKNCKVKYKKEVYILTGFSNGRAILRHIDWKKIFSSSIHIKYLTLVELPKNYVIEQVKK